MDVVSLRHPDSGPISDSRQKVGAKPGPDRISGLEYVRALAVTGVVALHAGVPYLTNPMPGLCWAIRDRPSAAVDVVFWTIEIFIMPLFLVIAGFLAFKTLNRRGAAALVRHRAKRLLIPLAFGCLVILPLDLHLWVLGWVSEGWVEPVKLRSFKFDGVIDRDLWGTSHLWFLQYLFLYVVVLAGLKRLVSLRGAGKTRGKASLTGGRSPTTQALFVVTATLSIWMRESISRVSPPRLPTRTLAFALFVLASLIVGMEPAVVWGFQHSFVPVVSKWVYCGCFFAAGVLLATRDPDLQQLGRAHDRLVGPAILFTLAAVALGRWTLATDQTHLASAVLAGLTVTAATSVTLAIMGWAVQRVRPIPMAIQYLAAASFWVYLVHHPLLGLIHIDLQWLFPGLNSAIKAALATAIALGTSLVMYEGLVRKSALGRWLGFAWNLPGDNNQQAEGDLPADRSLRADQVSADQNRSGGRHSVEAGAASPTLAGKTRAA